MTLDIRFLHVLALGKWLVGMLPNSLPAPGPGMDLSPILKFPNGGIDAKAPSSRD